MTNPQNIETAGVYCSKWLKAIKEPESDAEGNIICTCAATSIFKTKTTATNSMQASMSSFFYCGEASNW